VQRAEHGGQAFVVAQVDHDLSGHARDAAVGIDAVGCQPDQAHRLAGQRLGEQLKAARIIGDGELDSP